MHEAFAAHPEGQEEAGLHFNEGEQRQLGYDPEFKKALAKFPGIIGRFRALEAELRKLPPGSSLEDGGLSVTNLQIFENGRAKVNAFFKVEFDGQTLFVKRQTPEREHFIRKGEGFDHVPTEELRSTARAKKLLETMPYAEVLDGRLAYRDNEKSYYVAPWIEGVVLAEMFAHRNAYPDPQKIDILETKYNNAAGVLSVNGFKDVKPLNVLYDEKRDMLVFIDLHEQRPGALRKAA